MEHLRNLSARPDLVVDPAGRVVGEKVTTFSAKVTTRVGLNGPFGRERIVTALPTNKAGGPVRLAAPLLLHDPNGAQVADADGNLIGTPGLWVHRLVHARWTADTRRLAV